MYRLIICIADVIYDFNTVDDTRLATDMLKQIPVWEKRMRETIKHLTRLHPQGRVAPKQPFALRIFEATYISIRGGRAIERHAILALWNRMSIVNH